jgi:hypothetical protein
VVSRVGFEDIEADFRGVGLYISDIQADFEDIEADFEDIEADFRGVGLFIGAVEADFGNDASSVAAAVGAG